MAIKGKSRSRARRTVTPGPRPTFVPVRRPLLARRGFQVTALVVILVAATAGVVYGLAKERTKQRTEALQRSMRVAATKYQVGVDGALANVGQPLPPSGFKAFPALTTDVDGLRKGSVDAKTAAKDATSAIANAKTAATAMDKLDPASIFGGKGFDLAFVNYAINSQTKLADALKLYEQVGGLLQMAAEADGGQRSALLDRASAVLDVASTLFSDGYNDYVNLKNTAGIFTPTAIGGSGAPGAGG
ncbi:MAG TPA: hypothetical protein VFC04_02025 [Actinomycetota bacterium]|nr:hypothetical protein [Actinomycetota bacterium]